MAHVGDPGSGPYRTSSETEGLRRCSCLQPIMVKRSQHETSSNAGQAFRHMRNNAIRLDPADASKDTQARRTLTTAIGAQAGQTGREGPDRHVAGASEPLPRLRQSQW